MPERRKLHFDRLADVMPEVDRLLAGHTTLGTWTLAQICNHLSRTIIVLSEGYQGPRPPWVVRRLLGRTIYNWMVRRGGLPSGVKAPAVLLPKPGLDARAEAEALRAAIDQFGRRTDPMPEHPICGCLMHAEVERVQCIHCAHHLGFVLPASATMGEVATESRSNSAV